MSLNALAEKAGIDYQRVGRIERGETQMTIDVLTRIARVLQVPLSQLLEEGDGPGLQNSISAQANQEPSVYLIPSLYDKLDAFCNKHQLKVDNSVKVHLAAVMFKGIQDIRTNVKDDGDLVNALFQVIEAILEKLVLTTEKES
jgi:transcriptional regulator with XRE-family HTH domain